MFIVGLGFDSCPMCCTWSAVVFDHCPGNMVASPVRDGAGVLMKRLGCGLPFAITVSPFYSDVVRIIPATPQTGWPESVPGPAGVPGDNQFLLRSRDAHVQQPQALAT